jgi:hypothetical protein
MGRIKVAIWANETDNGTRHNVTITRLYKDGDEWKTSTSVGREELPLVAKIADLAHTWIYQQGQESMATRTNARTFMAKSLTFSLRSRCTTGPHIHQTRRPDNFRMISESPAAQR